MASATGNLNGSGSHQIRVELSYVSYSQSGNYSTWSWKAVFCNNNNLNWIMDGNTWQLTGFAASGPNGFQIPSSWAGTDEHVLGSGTFTKGHNSDGYLSAGTMTLTVNTNHSAIGDGSIGVSSGTPPRIPKVPDAPTMIGVDQPGATSLRVRFSSPSDTGGASIIDYNLQRATNSGFTTGVVNTTITAGSGGTHTISGLDNHEQYWFRVRARNSVGSGSYSSSASDSTLGHPTAPTNVVGTPSTTVTGRVALTWDAPATTGEGGITGYNIYRDGSQIGSTTGTGRTYTDNGRTPFTAYEYQVRARNAYSDSVSGMGPYSSVETVTAEGPPTPPRTLQGVSDGAIPGKVDLSWLAPTTAGAGGITGYTVRYANGTLVGTQGNTLTRSITGLTPGVSYTFVVTARNALADAEGSESAYSNQVVVTPLGEPNAPTGISVTASSTVSNRLVISWTAPAGTLSGYKIFERISGADTLIGTIPANHTSFTVDNVAAATSHTYVVRARTAYTDTLSTGYPGNWGGPASAEGTAIATSNNSQTVPNIAAVTDSTNATFNGTHVINAITATTIRFAKTAANIASSSSSGTISNVTNAIFNGTFTIATPTATTITYSKTNANIAALATTGGLVTDTDNVALNGTYTVTAVNVGANLVSYTKAGADFAARAVPPNVAPAQFGTVTNLSNAIFNGTGKVITAITEFTVSYAQTNANVAESNAAGKVTNTTNRDVFNGDWIVDTIPAYNIVEYARIGTNIALRTPITRNGLVFRTTSPSTLDVRFRSGWSG